MREDGSARNLEETECDVRYVFYVYAATCDIFFYRASSGAEPRAYAALCVGGVTLWCIIMSALNLSDSLPKP